MIRIGQGYDVHRLVEDRALMLGCVQIPFEKGLLGHSDADVLVHALADACLGALALGDIGQHFPDNDAAYKGMSGERLLREVLALVSAQGYRLGNADVTVLAQRPRLASHIPLMRERIAAIAGSELSSISIKATTEEGLGFTGSGEGIAAHAVVLLVPCR